MGYQKQNFADGEVLSALQLNHIEQGIVDVESSANATKTVVNKIIDPTLSLSGKAADAKIVGHNGYNVRPVNGTKPANIDDITEAGTYYYDESEMPDIGFTIYKYNQIIHLPAATASGYSDARQILISTPTSTTNAPLIYTRVKFANVWQQWFGLNGDTSNIHLPKIAFIGDSFTDANTGVKSYVDFLNEFGVCNGTNMGHSGATSHTWYVNHAKDITSQYDCFFIALGLNGTNRGSITDSFDADTFCGGMNGIINKILTVNPKARVILWCMDAWLEEPRIALTKELANKWGCEYFSMKSDANIPLRIGGKAEGVMPGLQQSVIDAKNSAYQVASDNAHPNENAQKLLAMYLKTIL